MGLSFLFFPFLFFVVWFWMAFVQRYRIQDLNAVRKQYRAITQKHKGSILLCPNHLTFLDSLILIWALVPPWRYCLTFRRFPWNLPKEAHVENNRLYRFICYLGKCICIPTDKDKSKQVMKKALYLTHHHQDLMIFPEGTRSKTGRINTSNYIYGVGQLMIDSPSLTVVSVYLRGRHQEKDSDFPKKGETFNISLQVLHPSTDKKGLRAMRDMASQLIDQLVLMEEDHFS
jgi:1-acyl-sn-glycerol-3-phosphate acyltransferase